MQETPPAAPPYQQLFELLKAQIMRGRYAPGTSLPSRAKLADMYKLAQMTVQRAVNMLQADGWVDSRPGVAVVVADPLPLIPTQTLVIEGEGEHYTEDDGRAGVVEVIPDDDCTASTYAFLRSWSSNRAHPDLCALNGHRLRVTVQVMEPVHTVLLREALDGEPEAVQWL